MFREKVRERERERQRERERDKEREREKDKEKERERERGGETETESERQTDRQTDRQRGALSIFNPLTRDNVFNLGLKDGQFVLKYSSCGDLLFSDPLIGLKVYTYK